MLVRRLQIAGGEAYQHAISFEIAFYTGTTVKTLVWPGDIEMNLFLKIYQ
jgi:hypothetical protein